MALKKFADAEVGGKIKEVREALGMSQASFGEAVFGHSQSAVDQWEKGRVPHALILREIARLADWSVDALLGLPGEGHLYRSLLGDLRNLVTKYEDRPSAQRLQKPARILKEMIEHGITSEHGPGSGSQTKDFDAKGKK